MYDGVIGVMGGTFQNQVATNPVSPDTGQSHCDHNVMIVRDPSKGGFSYNSGPAAGAGDTFAREPFTFNDNVVVYAGTQSRTEAFFGVAGKTVGAIEIKRNLIFGLDEPPPKLDARLYSNNLNIMVSPPPNVSISGNLAFTKNGEPRAVSVYIEPPQ
jgi:hypothetical protein